MISRPVYPGIRPPSWTRGQFFSSLKLSLDNCGFVIMGSPLWREDLSIVYSYCFASSAQFPRVRFTRDSWPNFIISKFRLPQSGGPSSRIYFPQVQCSLVIPAGNEFRMACPVGSLYRATGGISENTIFNSTAIVVCVSGSVIDVYLVVT
jgi:hypothetical protein